MVLEPDNPNERFRERRRRARRRIAIRRVGAVALLLLTVAAVALGASVLSSEGDGAAADETAEKGNAARASESKTAPEPRPLPAEIRGVHVTMALASLRGKLNEYFGLTRDGLNTLQLDVKDENGEVAFRRPSVPLARRVGAARTYYNPAAVLRKAHELGLYVIGRVVVFEDPILAQERPGLAIRTPTGAVWTTSGGLAWANPYDKRVWKYNVDVAEAAVEAGFDEIMFDYVRFPSDGDLASAVFKGEGRGQRSRTIARFLEYARARLEPRGARVSAAVFGLSATREMGIGQRPRRLAAHLDAVYPMVYPSHYGSGEYNLDDPNALPGFTVARSLKDFRRALRGRETLLVPWLQDFSLGREYTLDDVRAQIQAARDARSKGYLLWNPSGVYTPGTLEQD